jgi:hypothetical protein
MHKDSAGLPFGITVAFPSNFLSELRTEKDENLSGAQKSLGSQCSGDKEEEFH